MDNKINIGDILQDKRQGTKLYSPIFGECTFDHVSPSTGRIWVNKKYYDHTFDKYGRYWSTGECLLFPSKDMHDWERFTWKKGNILQYKSGGGVIFMEWSDNNYTHFKSSIYRDWVGLGMGKRMRTFSTEDFEKAQKETINFITSGIEYYSGSKLNLETLEIENKFKDGDIVFTKNNNIYIIKDCTDIVNNTYTYYVSYNPQEKRVTYNDWFYMPFTARLATDSEKQQLFDVLAKKGKRWDTEKKAIVDLPKKCEFKPMDWCLIQPSSGDLWLIAQYAYEWGEHYYFVGGMSVVKSCTLLPYNEQTKHLLGTTDEWEGDEK